MKIEKLMINFLFIRVSSKVVRFPRLEKRQRSEMCKMYKDKFIRKFQKDTWEKTDDSLCSFGNYLEKEDHADASRRLNFYRWLVGFQRTVSINKSYTRQCQECVVNSYANGGISHNIKEDSKCYTKLAASGCAYSNLANGIYNGADDIKAYIRDTNEKVLGHRRWCLNPSAYEFGLGRKGKYGALKVIGVIGGKFEETPMNAYPPQGPFPIDLLPQDWSFNLDHKIMKGKAPKSVKIKRSDGKEVETVYSESLMAGGIGAGNWIKFVPDEKMINVNYSYAVSITLDNGDIYKYTVMPTSCDDNITDSVFEERMGFFVFSGDRGVVIVFFAIAGVILLFSLIFNSIKMQIPQFNSNESEKEKSKSTSSKTIFV